MKILAIETSCDETAAAIVEDGRKVLSSVIASQIDIHAATGGVVPEVAAREHVLKVNAVVDEALKKAGMDNRAAARFDGVDAVAVTRGPGLLSSLLIGYSAAATLARILDKPLIPVHHVAGHIYSNWLEQPTKVQFPAVILTVSGGHNEIVLMRDEMDFQLIGETLDDAAGEAYDKVARLLGLGYPGGPAVSKAALNGNARAIKFPRALAEKSNFNFSFSGLKTAVLREIQEYHQKNGQLDKQFIADCSASFQEAVNDSLSEKLLAAAKKFQAREVHLAGGVSANKRLRTLVEEKMQNVKDCLLRYNSNLSFCTDNAAMIGAAAYFLYQKSPRDYSCQAEVFPEPQLDLYSKHV